MLRRRSGTADGALTAAAPATAVTRAWRARALAEWIARRCTLVIVCGFTIVALLALGSLRLTFSGDYEVYFDEENPRLQTLNALYDVFSRNDNLLFVIEPADGKVFTPDTLAIVRSLTESAWQLPHSVRVDSIFNYQRIDSRGDEIVIEDLIDAGTSPQALDMTRVEQRVLAEPALRGRLINAGSSATGINVQLELTGNRRLAVMAAAGAARELAHRFEQQHPQAAVHLSGNVMLNAAFPEASINDLKVLTPLMYLTMFLVTALFLRSLKSAVLTMLVVVAACAAAMGAAGWIGFSITSALVAAPTIITTVAIAGCVHLLGTIQRARARGMTLVDSVNHSLETNLRAMVVASVTTCIGFLSLNFSDAPPFRDLGTVAAIGVIVSLALTVLVLPAVILRIGCASREPMRPVFELSALARAIWRLRVAACVCVLLAMSALALVIPRMTLNDAFVEYFDQRVEFRRDTDRIMEILTGIYQLEFVADAGAQFGVHDPAYLKMLERFVGWLENQPEVTHVKSLVDTMQRLNAHVGGGGRTVPVSREAAAQYLLLYENSVPYGLDLNSRLSVDRSASRITASLHNLDNVALRDLEARAARWLEDNSVDEMRATATGTAVMFAYIAERNIDAMLSGGVLAALLIAIALAVVFASWRLGLLSLLPNLAPAVIAFGIWALLVGEMGIALAIVAAMTLGIVVDDTVHFVCQFLAARRRQGATPEQAVRHAFETTGGALVTTTVVLVLGFAVLSLSAYQVNHGMGQLASLVIACALVADFLMLPGLLAFACRRGWI